MHKKTTIPKELQVLEDTLDSITISLSQYFKRVKGWKTGVGYLKGLLSNAERKNSWQIAEKLGCATPTRFQHLINEGSWDEDKVRDHNETLIIEKLGEEGTWLVDETGFLKKGEKSAGVARQYSGTAGRVDNSQVGVFSSWKTPLGHALTDRELYIPEKWFENKDRCKEAGIPDDVTFKTKPQLASEMYNRMRTNGHKPLWVAADEAYGRDPNFRKTLEARQQQYVLAVPKDFFMRMGLLKRQAEKWGIDLKTDDWKRLSCGMGSQGERLYDWALIKRTEICQSGFSFYLLIRRSISDPTDLAYYTVFAKKGTTIQAIVMVAGERWSVEECFEAAKGETGLDQYEVRSYRGWYRHITLSMVAFTILLMAKIALAEMDQNNAQPAPSSQQSSVSEPTNSGEDRPPDKPSSMEAFKKKRQK